MKKKPKNSKEGKKKYHSESEETSMSDESYDDVDSEDQTISIES